MDGKDDVAAVKCMFWLNDQCMCSSSEVTAFFIISMSENAITLNASYKKVFLSKTIVSLIFECLSS